MCSLGLSVLCAFIYARLFVVCRVGCKQCDHVDTRRLIPIWASFTGQWDWQVTATPSTLPSPTLFTLESVVIKTVGFPRRNEFVMA